MDFPYTISYCIRKSLQLNSFTELTEDNQPPISIWFDDEALNQWFKNISNGDKNGIMISDEDIE